MGLEEELQEREFNEELFTLLKGRATEVDWFKIDVRIREVVGEVLVTFNEKLLKNQKMINTNFKDIQLHRNRLEELEHTADKFHRHREDYHLFYESFQEFLTKQKQQELLTTTNINELDKKLRIIDEFAQSSRHLIKESQQSIKENREYMKQTVNECHNLF